MVKCLDDPKPTSPDVSAAIGVMIAFNSDKTYAYLRTQNAVEIQNSAEVTVAVDSRVREMTMEEFERRIFGD